MNPHWDFLSKLIVFYFRSRRAAERYADVTPEERARRRERGWGETTHDIQPVEPRLDQEISKLNLQSSYVNHPTPPQDPIVNHRPHPPPAPLHVQTSNLTNNVSTQHSSKDASTFAVPFASQIVSPTHLKICHFGSRFLPHTTSRIRCILPLLADRIILIGHDDGLSVLDMFPQESVYRGEVVIKTPTEAQSRPIWKGERCVSLKSSMVNGFYFLILILLEFFKCLCWKLKTSAMAHRKGLSLLLSVLRMIRMHSAKITKICAQYECITLQVSLVSLGGRSKMR